MPMRRTGQASIIGSILFFVLFAAAMAGVSYYASSQSQANSAVNRAQSLEAQKSSEQLIFGALSNGSLTIQNTGSEAVTVIELLIKYSNGTVYTASPIKSSMASNNLLQVSKLLPPALQSRYNAILGSTNSADEIGVVTSRGNAFWLKPAVAAQTNPNLTYGVTFDASGTGSFGTTPVVTVDGVGYTASQLPVTLAWFAGTKHTYSYTTSLPLGTGSRIGVGSVQGISTSASGTITATSTGTVRTSYSTQYLLTVSGGNGIAFIGSPTNDGWYSSGSAGQFTSNYVWNVASGSRSNLVSYSLDGSSAASVTRSGSGIYTSTGVTMTAPHTITLTLATQYQLTASGGNGVSYSLASQTSDGWYDSGSSLTISSNYVWSQVTGQSRQNMLSYTLDGTTTNAARSNSGTYVTPTITMSASHTLTFNPATQYYLTVTGGSTTAVVDSQTNDGWFDSGSNAQAQSGYTWNAVTGQSRSNLFSYTVDGGSPTTIASRAASGTYTTPNVAMSTYHTLTFNPITQYYFTVNGGTSVVYVNSQTSDGWYDTGTTIAAITTSYAWSVVSGQSRQNLLSWNLDGGANTVVARSGSGTYTTTSVTMSTYHTVNFNGVTQYAINAVGGNSISYSGSITDDGWYDSGSTATVTTNYVWSVVAGQSRLNLVNWNLDGGANQAVARVGGGTFTTTSVTMNTFHTINFNAVTQYFVTVQSSVPASGSTGSVSISYSYSQQQSSSQLLGNGNLESGSTSPWSISGVCQSGGSLSIVTSPVHSGSYAMQVVRNGANVCAVQSLSFPSGTTSTSGTVSGWVYYPSTPTTNDFLGELVCMQSSTGIGEAQGTQTYGQFGPTGLSANTWTYESWTIGSGCGYGGTINFYIQADSTTGPYWDDMVWSMAYQYPVSGTTGSSSNSFSVSGTTVTYTYGIGYAFPGSTSSQSWYVSTSVGSEAYQSNTCGISPSGGRLTGSSSQSCTMTTTYGSSYSSSIGSSQTNDGWYDSGTSGVSVSASSGGPFSFGSWSLPSGITVTSSGSASSTITINNYGTVTANFNVNQ